MADTNLGYQDTPMLPDGRWHVHDGTRPQRPLVTPGAAGLPPSDALVLFDGGDLNRWRGGDGEPSGWIVADGAMQVPPHGTPGGGDIVTRDEFGDCQIHLEFCAPTPPRGDGQGRGNSGVFLMGRYEIQVLDSYDNPTYADGLCGAVYGQYPPLVNACRPPGEWQIYDILFTVPRFGDDGALVSSGYVTLLHNGVVLHNHVALIGRTGHRNLPGYAPHGLTGPLKLQDHGDPVRYRNLWVRPLQGYDESQ